MKHKVKFLLSGVILASATLLALIRASKSQVKLFALGEEEDPHAYSLTFDASSFTYALDDEDAYYYFELEAETKSKEINRTLSDTYVYYYLPQEGDKIENHLEFNTDNHILKMNFDVNSGSYISVAMEFRFTSLINQFTSVSASGSFTNYKGVTTYTLTDIGTPVYDEDDDCYHCNIYIDGYVEINLKSITFAYRC